MFAVTALISYFDLLDLVSISTRIHHHIPRLLNNRRCTSRPNWFDLAGTASLLFEPESLNTFASIEDVIAATLEQERMETEFSKQSEVPSHRNISWTDAPREGGGLDINDLVFRQQWTEYGRLQRSLLKHCDPEEHCDCKAHYCSGAQSTVGQTAAATTPAKSQGISLIIIVPPTPTPTGIYAYCSNR
jgi:hypothetical protein